MSAAAMLVYPDFFKVAVSESGNHENNIYNNTWSEKHHGMKEVDGQGRQGHFRVRDRQELGDREEPEGPPDAGRPATSTTTSIRRTPIRLADALIKANKRFDFMMLPGQRHAYGPVTEYFQWLRADYFCKYLLGDSDQSVDMWELNREKPQDNKIPGMPRRVISSASNSSRRGITLRSESWV